MLVPMRSVDIVCTRREAARTLRSVHRSGVVHLRGFVTPAGVGPAVFAPEDPLSTATPARLAHDRLIELAALLGQAPAPPALVTRPWELAEAALLERAGSLADVARRAEELVSRRGLLAGEIARLEGYGRIMDGLAGIVGRLPQVRGYVSTGIVVAARYRPVVSLIRLELERLTGGRCEVIAGDLGDDRVAAILLYPARQAAEVAALLGGRDLEEVALPEQLAGTPFDELGPRLDAERRRLRDELADVERSVAELGRIHGPTVAALRLVFADRLAEQAALAAAGGSDHLVVVSGWVPAPKLDELRATLRREVGPAVVVVDHEPSGGSPEAPVAMQNGPLMRAFEPLAAFVTIPHAAPRRHYRRNRRLTPMTARPQGDRRARGLPVDRPAGMDARDLCQLFLQPAMGCAAAAPIDRILNPRKYRNFHPRRR